ncbi:glycerophosphodiester phosphodiesterase [Geodermatophilus nigrescens]
MVTPGPAAPEQVQVVAHRGASAVAPEHTLAAYRQAVRLGADAVECDVRLTRDGVLVCVHDRRIDATSTGRGVVSALRLTDLEQHRFGHRRPRGAPVPGPRQLSGTEAEVEEDRDGGRVLTLERLLDYVTSTPGQVRLAIETKHPTRHSGQVELALVTALRRFGLLDGGRPPQWAGQPAVRVMSFSSTALRRLHLLAPALPCVYLLRQVQPWTVTRAVSAHAVAIGPSHLLLRRHPRLVERWQRAGLQVHTWTVNDAQDMQAMVALGVDAVITDHPALLLHVLGRRGPMTSDTAG